MKRSQRAGPSRPAGAPQESKPGWPLERHSGEGSASALETLQKLESHRLPTQPGDPPVTDPAAPPDPPTEPRP